MFSGERRVPPPLSCRGWPKPRQVRGQSADRTPIPYVPGQIPRGMVVYHWKTTAENIQDFSAFVKMESRVSSRGVLLAYLAVGFFLAASASLAASFIYDQTNGLGLKPDSRSASVEKTSLSRPPLDVQLNNSGNPSPLPQEMRQK